MNPELSMSAAPVFEAVPQEELLTPDMVFQNAEQDQAVEAVVANYEAQMGLRDRIANFGHNVVDATKNFASNHKRKAVAAGVGIVAAFGAAAPAEATTTTTNEGGTEYTLTASSSVLVGKSKSSASAFTKLNVIANHRTVSKAKIRKAEKAGNCKTFSPKAAVKAGIQTQGYNGSGTAYAPENGSRTTTACDTNNDGKYDVRKECGNKLIIRKSTPTKRKQTLWVNSMNNVNAKVKSKVVAEARTACAITNEIGTVTASAYGRAETSASATVKLRSVVRAKGSAIAKLETANMNRVSLSLNQKAKADAKVSCESKGGKVVIGGEVPPTTPETPEVPPTTPGKDGTQTPPAPATAPGPNPAPSSEEPYPGGYACYNETTGAPVAANPDTTCPTGSYGSAS